MSLQNIILTITAVLTGLIAGLFYSYSCSVNLGLGRLDDKDYLGAMQSINAAILNPAFFVGFMGTLILLPAVAGSIYASNGASLSFWLLLAAGLLYIAGAFGITLLGNVPLNEALASFRIDTATAAELAAQRNRFEVPWNRLHTIRTIASIASFAGSFGMHF